MPPEDGYGQYWKHVGVLLHSGISVINLFMFIRVYTTEL